MVFSMRFFILMLLSLTALADDLKLSWDIPTQRIDGTALESVEIDGYKIKHSIGSVARPEIVVNGGLTLEHLIQDISAVIRIELSCDNCKYEVR